MTIVNIYDLRLAARKRLPRFVFDFVDGGAYEEKTLVWNETAFDRWRFMSRALVDVARTDLKTSILGQDCALPLVLAPAGMCGLLAPRGEALAARAAADAAVPFCLSTASICSIEQVRAAAPRPFWFQLYVTKDRGITAELISRAAAAQCSALVLTVDSPVHARRERDVRNRFMLSGRPGLMQWLAVARHVRWALAMARAPYPRFGNLASMTGAGARIASQAQFVLRNMDQSVTWRDLEWLRAQWRGKLVVKGIMAPGDAVRAAVAGADAVIVSNHGGRQLDGAMASIEALPAVIDAAGDRLDVLLDSGIRRGQHVVKALALGAKACVIGRAYLYGLAALGQSGVTLALSILSAEIAATLAHIGVTDVKQLHAKRDEFLVRA